MKAGFTLLELLIGIAIFAVVAASVYTSFYLGVKTWRHEETRDEGLQQAMLALETMALRLRCAFVSADNEKIKFKGSNEQIDFFTVNAEGDIENLIFFLEPRDSGQGYSLRQSSKKYIYLNDENPPEIEVINSFVKNFKVSYFNAKEQLWLEDWPEELKLPEQVKIEVDFEKNNLESSSLRLEKYVNILVTNEIILPKYETL
ncbi:MAG: prepilin-type N-terminal cleavage/methylation domain-containing protein [Candidatus Omnitrophica bacterium]|nr:prepilin-type N-terminal cleavage/methylation domain-containing protein [Candidatus Omnitrophota bacterium]